MIQIIPAIDIMRGKVVRLEQGAAESQTVYPDSPVDMAKKWASFGVGLIHVVDLDGAMEGDIRNLDIVKDIVKAVKAKIELGGGLRSEESISKAIDAGVSKVVIGTKALDEKFLKKIAKDFKDKIVVGIDSSNGFVSTKGWLFKTKIKATDLVKKVEEAGIRTVNYTDISRDGMLKGPNIDSLRAILRASKLDIVASGGVSTIDDVLRLKALEAEGLKGIIIGKALYEKRIDLAEAIKICSQKG